MKNLYKKVLTWALISFLIFSTSFAYDLSASDMIRWDNITVKLNNLINSKPENSQTKFKTKIVNSLASLKIKMKKNDQTVALINYVINKLVNNQVSSWEDITTPANANWEVPYSNCSKAWQTFNAKSVYSDPVAWSCNTPDKIICTRAGYAQVWSMCNAWSSTSGLSSSSYGWYYQWWNGWDISFSPVSTTKPIDCSNVNNSSYSSSANFIKVDWWDDYDWCSGSQNSNEWWDTTDIPVWWKSKNPSARKWPCADWYHVPSVNQWKYAYNNGYPNIQTTLSLSLAGLRHSYGNMEKQNNWGHYWSSSPSNNMAYNLSFTNTSINPSDSDKHTFWLSVRCIKD